jgi:DNA-directed RNA polymerase
MQAAALAGRVASQENNIKPSLYWQVPFLNYQVVSHYRNYLVARNAVTVKNKWKYFTFRCVKSTFDNANNFVEANKIKMPKILSKDAYGIVPNFIHSLDATNILLVVASWQHNIGIIHDSVGVTPNNLVAVKLSFK